MGSLAAVPPAASASFCVSSSPSVLARATRPGVDVAVWTRSIPGPVRAALAHCAASASATVDRVARLDAGGDPALCAEVDAILAAVPGDAGAWLRGDVANLLGRFAALARRSEARVFFGVIYDDQCRKFHVDAVRLRLVTTYAGPGTEWVPREAVDHGALSRLFVCPSEANAAIVPVPSSIRRAEPGHVLVLRGSRHEDTPGRAVHRSPPIERSGALRVALVVTDLGEASP